ncbi:MAG: hypothetical protein AB7I30_03985 [Isosphaeraceae bacterium]
MRRGIVAFATALPLLTFAACSSGDGLPREAVSGSITLDGKPVEKGFVSFLPENPELATQGGGSISAGSYQIPRAQGLVPGTYKVMITSAASEETKDDTNESPGMPPAPSKEGIPARYNVNTTLTAEIKAGGGNVVDFALTAKPAPK